MLIALLLLAAPDFEIEYESYVPPRYEVFVFLGTECPMAKLYANRLSELADRYPQIHFQGVSANESDTAAEIATFQNGLRFGFRRNPQLAARLKPTRSPEAFFFVDDKLVYHGRIDDQYTPGTNRSQPSRNDLEEAIKETLAGQSVSVPETKATGCHIEVPQTPTGKITFDEVAPILHSRCAECHRPGEVAPFSLLTYEDTLGWKDTIREVVSANRMPPWHADPNHGKFANDRSLTAAEKSTLLAWVEAGAPAGTQKVAAPTFKTGWAIKTDLILKVQTPFAVPAEGVLGYQEFTLDPGFKKDTWVQAVEIQPGNKAVVHHINVYLRPKNAEGKYYTNEMQDGYLAMTVPGNTVTSWPVGIAKVIPAGFQVVLSVHYQPNGKPQQDQSSIAFQFADPPSVHKQAATRVFMGGFSIPPNTVTMATQEWKLEEDYTLYALYPHMHLRGRSMRFEIGDEVLLDVPHFDFNWQHRYVLAEPRTLPAGTIVRCTAVYDNTAANPNNPNPNATVKPGLQSTDEMFQSCFEVVRANEDRQSRPFSVLPAFTAILCASGLFLRRSWRK